MKKTSLLALILALLTLLTACGGSGDGEPATTPSEATEEGTEASIWEGLPEINTDEDFVIYTIRCANFRSNMLGEEGAQDIVNEAQHKAKITLGEQLGVSLMEYPVGDDMKQFSDSIYAGFDSYSLGYTRCTVAIQMYNNGLLLPYDGMPVVDLSTPWWNTEVNDSLSVNNNQYVALGSFDLSTYDYTHALLFNKKLAQSHALDLYGEVTEKAWTFDRFYEIIRQVSTDANGGEKVWGYLCQSKEVLPNFWIAADLLTVDKETDTDLPYLACGTEQFDTVFRRTFEMLRDNGTWYFIAEGNDVPDENIALFNGNSALFMDSTFYYVNRLRAENDGFGILPYPMYTAEQGQYRSRIEYYMPGVIPKTTKDTQRTGAVLEALNRAYYSTVTEPYYESVLRLKNSTDAESYDMVELIFSTQVIDIGDTTLNGTIRDGIFAPMWVRNKPNLASYLKSMEGIVAKYLHASEE